MSSMNEGMENLKEIEALKQQLHTEREAHQKEMALVREDAQVEIMRRDQRISELEKINNEHQKLNGELQVKLSQYEDKAAHYRRKAVL